MSNKLAFKWENIGHRQGQRLWFNNSCLGRVERLQNEHGWMYVSWFEPNGSETPTINTCCVDDF